MKKISAVFAIILLIISTSCDKDYSVDMSLLPGSWELVKPQDKPSAPKTLTFDGNKCMSSNSESFDECEYYVDGHKIILLRNVFGGSFYYQVTRLDSGYLVFDSMQKALMRKDRCDGTYTYRRVE